MLTYTGSIELYKKLTKNSSSENVSLGDILINEKARLLTARKSWSFMEATKELDTVANQQFYDLPFNFKLLDGITLTISSQVYTPEPAPNRKFWDRLNSTTPASDIPDFYFIFNNQIGFYPKPSSSGNTLTITYKKRFRDILLADYTTGSIKTTTNGGTAVVGNSTVWTSQMAGRWIRITKSNTVNTGDGEWYEIDSVTDATNLVLVKGYNGSAITAGSAPYAIGEISDIPEDYQIIPVYQSVSEYWSTIGDKPSKAVYYKTIADELFKEMFGIYNSPIGDPVVYEGSDVEIINPNLTLTL